MKPIKQINEKRRWTQAFCEWNKSFYINMLCVSAKFVSFEERQRSLIPAIGFVSFVQFVVKTKENDSFWQQTTLLNESAVEPALSLQRIFIVRPCFSVTFRCKNKVFLFIVTKIALKWMQCDLLKQFFLLKDIYFKKKDYFCKQQKKEVINCIIFCKSI